MVVVVQRVSQKKFFFEIVIKKQKGHLLKKIISH